MSGKRAWTMPEEARPFLQMLDERIQSPEIEVRHRDSLIRLRQVIEEKLAADGTWTSAVDESDRHAA